MQASLERLRRRREDSESEGGFTLIELLIVIVILGILAAIVVFAVQSLSGQSSQAACGSDYKTVEAAAEAFKAQVGSYPDTTLPNSWGFPGSAATFTPPAAPTTGVSTGVSFAGEGQLVNEYNNGSATIGPWLKDYSFNNSHYSITVSQDGLGTVNVFNATGTNETTASGNPGCSAVG